MIRISAFLAVLIVLGGVGGAGAQTITGGTGGATACAGLSDAGTACTKNTGTSGATVPLNNGANTFSATQMVNLNAAAAPAPITGTALQVTGADGVTGRVQATAFGAITAFSGARYDGTGASPTAVVSGDQITGVNAYAYGGGVLNGPIASIRTYAAENIDATHWGSKAFISTTPLASTTLTDTFGSYAGVSNYVPSGADFAIYNVGDPGTANYERTRGFWSGNIFNLKSEAGGTGTLRQLNLGSGVVTINSTALTLTATTYGSNGAFRVTAGGSVAGGVDMVINSTYTQASGLAVGFSIAPTISQTVTGGYTALLINPTESATGSGAKNLILAQVGSSDRFKVSSTGTGTFANSVVTTPHTVAGLPGSPVDGQRDFVTDATACTFASAPTGGGSTHCPVYYDGGASGWKEG